MNIVKSSTLALCMLFGSSSLFALSVEVEKTKDWGSGFCAKVIVSNDTETPEIWDISFYPRGVITSLWNANYVQDPSSLITTATGVSWNEVVKANATRSFGYCANIKSSEEGDLEVLQTQEDVWEGGFCNRVIVNNLTEHDLKWEVTFPVKGEIFTLWNAKYTQDENTLSTVSKGVDWNKVVDVNESVSFGYCADSIVEEAPAPEPIILIASEYITLDEILDAFILDIFSAFDVGFGGGYSIPFASEVENEKIWVSSISLILDEVIEESSYFNQIQNFDALAFDELQQSLQNSKFLVYWVTEGWKESWFNASKIQKAMDEGYVPVFNYWYFGDKLDGIPTQAEQDAYALDNQRLVTFLNQLNGTKFLIMEPEFNKRSIIGTVDTQHQFASIIGSAIDSIRTNTSNVYFSLAMTDTGSRGVENVNDKCGYEMCALGDKYEWEKPSTVYNDLLSRLDFISFQEMVAQFSRDPSNSGTWSNPIPIAYSNEDIGIDYLAQRVANFAMFLKEQYNKPVFLPYIAIATASWSDTNNNQAIENSEIDTAGWEEEANNAYEELSAMKSELQANGLFGFAVMSLFDDPQQDEGGYQYFMQNEYHLGLIKSSAQGGVDIAAHGDIQVKGDLINTIFNTP